MVWVVPTLDSAARRDCGNEQQQIVAVSKQICNRCILVLCPFRVRVLRMAGGQLTKLDLDDKRDGYAALPTALGRSE